MTRHSSAATTLIERNGMRAGGLRAVPQSLSPRLATLILCCADHRVDPAHALGIDLGEAIVLRNLGGRVTPDVVRSLVVLATIAAVESLSTDIELVIVHHTDCGLSRLASAAYAPLMADYLGVGENQVADLHLDDPGQAVSEDIARLRADPVVPGSLVVSGLVYDVASGRARLAHPSQRLDGNAV